MEQDLSILRKIIRNTLSEGLNNNGNDCEERKDAYYTESALAHNSIIDVKKICDNYLENLSELNYNRLFSIL